MVVCEQEQNIRALGCLRRLGCHTGGEPRHQTKQKGGVSLLRMVKLVKPLRLLRLLRMLKMFNSRALKALKDSIVVEPDQMRLVKIGMGVLISCHFAGCLFWLVKSLSNEDSPDNLNHFLMIVGNN